MDRSIQRLNGIAAAALSAAFTLGAPPVVGNGAGDAELGPRLRRALVASSAAKIVVAEFYMTQGRMPATAGEAGLEPPDTGDPVGWSIVSEGAIALEIASSTSPARRHVFLLPQLSPSRLSWKCVSNDIPAIADLVPGCGFDPAYVPTHETPESLEAKANPGWIVLNLDGKRFRLRPEGVVSGSPDSAVGAAEVNGLSEAGRERLITTTLDRVADKLDSLDRVLNVVRWLEAMGPSMRAVLDRRIGDEPSTGGAALLALCDVSPRPTQAGMANQCVTARAPRAPKAIERLNELAVRQLRDPYDHPYYAERLFDCSGAIAVLAALGAQARPAAGALGALMDDPRTEIWTAGHNYCKPRDIVVTLLRILLEAPPDTTHPALVDDAVAALARVVILGPHERNAELAWLGPLLDARTELKERLTRRIGPLANDWAQQCKAITYETPALIIDLGTLGFDALQPFLDHACYVDEYYGHTTTELSALGALLVAYPAQATKRYRLARTGYGRDAFITAALTSVREISDDRIKQRLRQFLIATGYAPVRVVPFQVSFPGHPELKWTSYPNWTIPFSTASRVADLRAAYRDFADRWSECSVAAGDEDAWRSVENGKRFFVFPCGDDEPWMAAIGSPEGFKRMQLPDWIGGQRFDKDSIVGVSDVDQNGRLEILLVFHCDARDSACAEGEVPDTYEFMEEDGDRFSYFRVRP